MEKNETSLKALCASLCEIMGVEPPKFAEKSHSPLVEYAKEADLRIYV